jgi:hypothetical protein
MLEKKKFAEGCGVCNKKQIMMLKERNGRATKQCD